MNKTFETREKNDAGAEHMHASTPDYSTCNEEKNKEQVRGVDVGHVRTKHTLRRADERPGEPKKQLMTQILHYYKVYLHTSPRSRFTSHIIVDHLERSRFTSTVESSTSCISRHDISCRKC